MKVTVISQHDEELNILARSLSMVDDINVKMIKSSLILTDLDSVDQIVNGSDLIVVNFDFDERVMDFFVGALTSRYIPMIAYDPSSGRSVVVSNNLQLYRKTYLTSVSDVESLMKVASQLSQVLGKNLGVTHDLASVIALVQSTTRKSTLD